MKTTLGFRKKGRRFPEGPTKSAAPCGREQSYRELWPAVLTCFPHSIHTFLTTGLHLLHSSVYTDTEANSSGVCVYPTARKNPRQCWLPKVSPLVRHSLGQGHSFGCRQVLCRGGRGQ